MRSHRFFGSIGIPRLDMIYYRSVLCITNFQGFQ